MKSWLVHDGILITADLVGGCFPNPSEKKYAQVKLDHFPQVDRKNMEEKALPGGSSHDL